MRHAACNSLEEGLEQVLGYDGGAMLFLDAACSECRWPLVLAAGTGVSSLLTDISEEDPALDVDRSDEWLDEPLHAYLYCDGPGCPVGAPVDLSGGGVDVAKTGVEA